MMTLEFGRPNTEADCGNRFRRSTTRRSLVQPTSSMTAGRSAAVATVSKRPIGGKRDGISR